MEIAVSEAAERLGMDESRVRQLLRGGDLVGRRVGRSWLVAAEDVARLESQRGLRGRPMGPGRSWGLLDLLDGCSAPWLSPAARSQTRSALRRLDGADANRWRSALRGRSQLLRCAAHPGALSRLLAHDCVLTAGPNEAASRGVDLVAGEGVAQVYVPEDEWPSLASALMIDEVTSGVNLVVRIPRGVWPFGDRNQVSLPALAADLLEAPEPRAVSGGLAKLHELTRQLLAARA